MKIQVKLLLVIAALSGTSSNQVKAYDNLIEAGKTAGLVAGAGVLYLATEFTAMHLRSRGQSDSYLPPVACYTNAFFKGTRWGLMTGLPMAGLVAGSQLQASDVVTPLTKGLGLLFVTSRVVGEVGYRRVYENEAMRDEIALKWKSRPRSEQVNYCLDSKARDAGLENSCRWVDRGLCWGSIFMILYTGYQCYQKA